VAEYVTRDENRITPPQISTGHEYLLGYIDNVVTWTFYFSVNDNSIFQELSSKWLSSH